MSLIARHWGPLSPSTINWWNAFERLFSLQIPRESLAKLRRDLGVVLLRHLRSASSEDSMGDRILPSQVRHVWSNSQLTSLSTSPNALDEF
jgi:hypothetical protein